MAMLISIAPLAACGQIQRSIMTGDGRETRDISPQQPLSWWTKNLRLDARDELLDQVSERDQRIAQSVTRIGTISGKSIIQVITTIHGGPSYRLCGWR
jgi:hypothetical protein